MNREVNPDDDNEQPSPAAKACNEYMVMDVTTLGGEVDVESAKPFTGPVDAKRRMVKSGRAGIFHVWRKVAEFEVRERPVPVFEVV